MNILMFVNTIFRELQSNYTYFTTHQMFYVHLLAVHGKF